MHPAVGWRLPRQGGFFQCPRFRSGSAGDIWGQEENGISPPVQIHDRSMGLMKEGFGSLKKRLVDRTTASPPVYPLLFPDRLLSENVHVDPMGSQGVAPAIQRLAAMDVVD